MARYIQTFTGIKFDFRFPTEDMFNILDVAHHLSQVNRFCGAAKFAYSVGYHCLLAADKAPEEFKLEALLHELDEPYIGDISYPLKSYFKDYSNELSNIAFDIKTVGAFKFKLDFFSSKYIIQEIDCRLAITEELQLMRHSGYLQGSKYEGLKPYKDLEIIKLQPENVEELFLKEFYRLERK